MSYILEALKKAEQQRDLGKVPGIDSAHESVSSVASRRWLLVISVVLVLNAALLVVLLWPEEDAAQLADAGSGPQPAAAAAVSEPPVSQKQAAVVYAPEPRSMPEPETLRPIPVVPAAKASHRQTAGIAGGPSATRQPVETPAAVSEPLREIPARPVAVERVQDPVLPLWPQIPAHVFQELNGNLRLDVHVYSDQPADRFVLINLRKYHEGEQLREGPQVEEITPGGAVLSFRGERFRLQSQ